MELIVTPYKMEDIVRLHQAGANSIVVATPFFSACSAAYFTIAQFATIADICSQLQMQLYVMVNRFFMEEEIAELREHLRFLKTLPIAGIYYGDDGVLYEAKKLGMEALLIYHPDTLLTNKEDVQFFLEEGMQRVSLANEITLDEICDIASNVHGACELMIHGHLHMMHSKRFLLQNYFEFLGKQQDTLYKRNMTIKEEQREERMPIMEDASGTHVFSGFTLVSFEEVERLEQAGITHMRINGIFSTMDALCDAIHGYLDVLHHRSSGKEAYQRFQQLHLEEHCSHGFYYTKTSTIK